MEIIELIRIPRPDIDNRLAHHPASLDKTLSRMKLKEFASLLDRVVGNPK